MYENQGIYSLPCIKGNLLGTFNSQTAKKKIELRHVRF